MANLIDVSYFIRKINIPNTGNAAISERLTSFISQYESECLTNILGYALYQKILTETSQRITDLKDGAEYTNRCGELVKWMGLLYDPKISLIANYVYVKIQEDSVSQTTGVSTSVIATEGGQSISAADKIVDAWNFFSDEVKHLLFFLWDKNTGDTKVYPEFTTEQSRRTMEFARHINILGI